MRPKAMLVSLGAMQVATTSQTNTTSEKENHSGYSATRYRRGYRYVERNALPRTPIKWEEARRWSSLHRQDSGTAAEKELLSAWPLRRTATCVHVSNPTGPISCSLLQARFAFSTSPLLFDAQQHQCRTVVDLTAFSLPAADGLQPHK